MVLSRKASIVVVLLLLAAPASFTHEVGAAAAPDSARLANSSHEASGGASAQAKRGPRESRYYAPCIDRGPVRLHSRGITIEPISTEARTEGVYYVMGASVGETQGRDGMIRWQDLDGVDVWGATSGGSTQSGAALGLLVGVGVMLLATDSPGGFGDFFYPLTIMVGAAPFALVGALIGSRRGGSNQGHWVKCRSVWYPYGTNASVVPSATPSARDALAASPSP